MLDSSGTRRFGRLAPAAHRWCTINSALVHDGTVTIKHVTASTFVFARFGSGWRLGLILHPLFGRLMIPGGHVESEENPPEAARREVAEETGREVRFVPPLAPVAPTEIRADRRLVAQPWWIMEQPVERDNHVGEPHYHVDHLYVAIADAAEPVGDPAHPFGWHTAEELATLDMFEDTRLFAAALFADIDAIAAAVSRPDQVAAVRAR